MFDTANLLNICEISLTLKKNKTSLCETALTLLKPFSLVPTLNKVGIKKREGATPDLLITLMILFPLFNLSTVRKFFLSEYENLMTFKKDSFFRFKNNPEYNWRKLLYQIVRKHQAISQQQDHQNTYTSRKCLIFDDTT